MGNADPKAGVDRPDPAYPLRGTVARDDDPFAPVFPSPPETVRVDCSTVMTWADFHTAFADAMGFPDFYGRNMNAWIDCMGDLREDSWMSRFHLEGGQLLQVEVIGATPFRERVPEVFAAFLDATTFVNTERNPGCGPSIAIVLR